MDPLLAPTTSVASTSLEHVVALSTRASYLYWSLSAILAAAGLAVTEMVSWTNLSTRTVTGCAAGANAAVASNSTLASCAALGFFDSGAGASVRTAPPSSWTGGLFLMFLAVVLLWVGAAVFITCQTWRASALLPHGIFVRAVRFNGRFYFSALVVTGLYIVCKYLTFNSQPSTTTVISRGGTVITVRLAAVFEQGGAIGHGGLAALGASLATLGRSF